MMRTNLSFILGVTVIVACGGSTGTGLGDGGGDDGGDASTTNDGGNDATPNDSGGGDGAACPSEQGLYSVAFSGPDCGTVGTQASICIQENACTITLTTGITSGGANEVSGTTPIGADGSFTNGAIKEGSVNRTGCTGTWDSGTSTLTIVCGGASTTQTCTATLVRTAANCT